MKKKLKFWFFRNYWWFFILLFILFLGIISLAESEKRWNMAISGITILITSFFFIQKQRIEELRLFHDIFKEFNERYNKLNDALNRIFDAKEDAPISPDERGTLYDYFNLCGEEYFYYKQGHIYSEVWTSWINGMNYFYGNSRIGKIWDDELGQNSYYGFNKKLLK